MTRDGTRWMRGWCVGAAALVACGDPGAPGVPTGGDDGAGGAETVLVSQIGARAYVALPPASVPGAHRALVQAQGGDSARAVALDGGFDPLAIGASAGELVTVTVTDSSGRVTATSVKVAPRPPRVVRLSPAERRTDVPLNARVLVVFSVPMDSGTTAARVRLLRGGAPLAGRVELSMGGVVAEFVPSTPLAALTEYTLVVDGAVTDVRGTPMGEPVTGTFRTGSAVGEVAMVLLSGLDPDCFDYVERCAPNRLVLGQGFLVDAQLRDARGLTLKQVQSVAWRSSDERVLALTVGGANYVWVELRGYGRAAVLATAGGVTASLEIQADPPLAIDRLRPWAVLEARTEGTGTTLWRVPLDGAEPLRLASSAELPADPQCGPWSCTATHEFAVARGGRIAITRASATGGVWIKDDHAAAPRAVLASGTAGSARAPAWAPDGDRLAYWLDRDDVGESELRVVNADGTDERVLRRVPYEPGANAGLVWHADGQRLLLWTTDGTTAVPLDGSPPSSYLTGYLAGPWLSDLRTQLVYGRGNFAEQVVPAFMWGLLTEAGLQGPWAAAPGLPVGLASDVGIAAYSDGVLTLAAQWCYVPSGRVLGFAP